jgi:hypothetical protein
MYLTFGTQNTPIMLNDLIKILNEWLDVVEFAVSKKTFYPKPNRFSKGEFLIEITKSVTIKRRNHTIHVEVVKEMCTQHVALGALNPEADIITLNNMLRDMDYEFLSKLIEAESDLNKIYKA